MVQNFGRIRRQRQGRDALVDILYVDLSVQDPGFWSKLCAAAKRSAVNLKNESNGLVGNVDDYLEFCSVVGVKQFIEMDGCRMVNAYRAYGGTKESCGRCDNCMGGCAHTAASNRRYKALDQTNSHRIKCRRFFSMLEVACVIYNQPECDGKYENKCNNAGHSCFLCGWQGNFQAHRSANCKAKESQYMPNGYCWFCLGIKEDNGGVDDHGGQPNKCKMKKRLHRFFRHCFRKKYGNPNDNGESYVKFMGEIFANTETYYSKNCGACRKRGYSIGPVDLSCTICSIINICKYK